MPPKQTYRTTTIALAITSILCLFPLAQALGHGISHADQQAMLSGGLMQYIWLGATHMLTGYDHLLFLFGVIFFLTGFRDIVKFITAFTIGHSITLLLATLWGITANYYLVDAVIAISVMYKGFENIDGFPKYLNTKSPNLVWVVFGFGLIHGFGLSTRLQQLPLGDEGMVMRILSFNLGVELGQIVALIAMLMFMTAWNQRPSFAVFSRVANVGLIFAGGLLFLMQMHGYMHTRYPDDFGFSKDHHYHEHLRMKQSKTHSHGGKPHSHGSKPHSHGGKPHSHGSKPHSHGGKPHSHDDGKSHSHSDKAHSHDDGKAHSHGDKAHSHGDKAHSHGDKSHRHGDKSHRHGDKAHSHGNKAHSHGNKAHNHGDKAHSHGEKPHSHGTTPPTRPKALSQPQVPTSRPHSHGKTPRAHGKQGHTHGPSSRPHSHGPTTKGHTHGKHGHTHGNHRHDHKDHSHDDDDDD